MGKVTAAEAKHVLVERFLREKGFEAYSYSREGTLRVNIISMPEEKHFLWWKWQGRSRFLPGTLFIKDDEKGAEGSTWVMHVDGNPIFQRMTVLAEDLSQKFDVDIHVRLENEHLQFPVHWD